MDVGKGSSLVPMRMEALSINMDRRKIGRAGAFVSQLVEAIHNRSSCWHCA